MEAAWTSETVSYLTTLHGITSQKTLTSYIFEKICKAKF